MNRNWTQIELDESFDLEKIKAWFMDGVHTVPRWSVFPLDHVWPNVERGLCWGTQKISHPQLKGWIWRTRDGSAFLAPRIVKDPKEMEERMIAFRTNLKPFIENFKGIWDTYKQKWDKVWSRKR